MPLSKRKNGPRAMPEIYIHEVFHLSFVFGSFHGKLSVVFKVYIPRHNSTFCYLRVTDVFKNFWFLDRVLSLWKTDQFFANLEC